MIQKQLLIITNDRAGSICSVMSRRRELQGVAAGARECLRAGGECVEGEQKKRAKGGANQRRDHRDRGTDTQVSLYARHVCHCQRIRVRLVQAEYMNDSG